MQYPWAPISVVVGTSISSCTLKKEEPHHSCFTIWFQLLILHKRRFKKKKVLLNGSRENSRHSQQHAAQHPSFKLWGKKIEIKRKVDDKLLCTREGKGEEMSFSHLLNMLLKDQLQIFEGLHSQAGDLQQRQDVKTSTEQRKSTKFPGYGSESYISLTNIIL